MTGQDLSPDCDGMEDVILSLSLHMLMMLAVCK